MKKEIFCTNCGRKFIPVGREHICPACKTEAAANAKKAAVLRAKRASWTGESVPVRISGRASTVIRAYGKANGMPFAESLDDLLKASDYFKGIGVKWEEVEPYKSRRRDKNTTETAQEGKQEGKQEVTKLAKPVKQASKATSKAVGKNASKATSKAKIK